MVKIYEILMKQNLWDFKSKIPYYCKVISTQLSNPKSMEFVIKQEVELRLMESEFKTIPIELK